MSMGNLGARMLRVSSRRVNPYPVSASAVERNLAGAGYSVWDRALLAVHFQFEVMKWESAAGSLCFSPPRWLAPYSHHPKRQLQRSWGMQALALASTGSPRITPWNLGTTGVQGSFPCTRFSDTGRSRSCSRATARELDMK